MPPPSAQYCPLWYGVQWTLICSQGENCCSECKQGIWILLATMRRAKELTGENKQLDTLVSPGSGLIPARESEGWVLRPVPQP